MHETCRTAGAPVAALADQCVKCGLCLPHCPTYRLTRDESESPRGRIALASALTSGVLAPTPLALVHLDHCLGCLSCQKVCPSQVRYDEILVRTRAALVDAPRAAAGLPALARRWLRDPIRLNRLARLAAATRAERWLRPLARCLPSSRWRRLADALPDAPPALRFGATRRRAARGRVGLFRGCVADVYDRDTLAAARALLEASGYEVVESAGTACCGALARHRGELDAAARSAATTRGAFAAAGVDHVLVAASGCYGDLRDEVFAGGAVRVLDVHAFLADDAGFAALGFRALARRAALHLPCTQVNVVGALAAIHALLARVPELVVLPLPEQPRCCGAAGSYFLEHAEFAAPLRDEKLDQAAALAPDLLLTTNVGCRIHLGNGLRRRATALPVRHPLALLAAQLDNVAA
ncbi:MAG TPA: (Fe-S)-binding protein [Dokdonella sp.]